MKSDGRAEKRTTTRVLVRIVPVNNALLAETTAMVDISRNGARILTSRRWHPGERLYLNLLSGAVRRQGRVIYCYPQTDGQFSVGIKLDVNLKIAS
jgi:hypothetical protein